MRIASLVMLCFVFSCFQVEAQIPDPVQPQPILPRPPVYSDPTVGPSVTTSQIQRPNTEFAENANQDSNERMVNLEYKLIVSELQKNPITAEQQLSADYYPYWQPVQVNIDRVEALDPQLYEGVILPGYVVIHTSSTISTNATAIRFHSGEQQKTISLFHGQPLSNQSLQSASGSNICMNILGWCSGTTVKYTLGTYPNGTTFKGATPLATVQALFAQQTLPKTDESKKDQVDPKTLCDGSCTNGTCTFQDLSEISGDVTYKKNSTGGYDVTTTKDVGSVTLVTTCMCP